jgi:hypothetical protein
MRERASATPDGGHPSPELRGVYANAAASAASEAPLQERLAWFATAVMRADAPGEALDEATAARFLTAGPSLGPLDRLEIYRRAYRSRLVECLADDYPVLQHALGPVAFVELCRGYVARHPSRSPSLNYFGARMATFCRDEAPEPFAERAFASDLATLEWAIVEVIHAPSSDPLTVEDLSKLRPESWASARMMPNTALRIVRTEYPVNAYFQAVHDDADPPLPAAEPSATVVYRSGTTVWRMDLSEPMFQVITALVAGETLGASLSRAERALAGVDSEQAARSVTNWFREWVSSGLFVDVLTA